MMYDHVICLFAWFSEGGVYANLNQKRALSALLPVVFSLHQVSEGSFFVRFPTPLDSPSDSAFGHGKLFSIGADPTHPANAANGS